MRAFLNKDLRKMAKKKQVKNDETLIDITEVREQAVDIFEHYRLYILAGLGVLVLLVGGLFAYNNFYKKPKQIEAVEQMFQAQQQFERDSFALALTNPGGGYLGFLDIIDNYKGTPAANMSLYYAGVCYLNIGQYEAAVSYLKDFNAKGAIMPIMKNGTLGDAYSELNDFDKAMSFYKKAISAGDNELLTPYYMKKLALLHEKDGKTADALKLYEEIKNKYPTSPDGLDIEKYIVRVSPQG